MALNLNKLNEISPVVLDKKILKYFQYNFIFSLLSPLWEGRGPSFEQTFIPSTQGCFVPSLVQIGQTVLEKKLKMRKFYRTDKRQSEKLTWAFSSGELKTGVYHFDLHDDCVYKENLP